LSEGPFREVLAEDVPVDLARGALTVVDDDLLDECAVGGGEVSYGGDGGAFVALLLVCFRASSAA
jgi:hypothetical protein